MIEHIDKNCIADKIQLRWDNNDDIISFIGKNKFDSDFKFCCIDMINDEVDYQTIYNGRIGIEYKSNDGKSFLISEGCYIVKNHKGEIGFVGYDYFV